MICNLISKVVVVANPTESAKKLAEFLKRRKFLGYEILKCEGDIDLTLNELLNLIRELIKVEDRISVMSILEKESHRWIEEVDFAVKMIGSGKPKLLQEETLFHKEMMGEGLYRQF